MIVSDQTGKAGDGIHENHWCEHPGCRKWGRLRIQSEQSQKPHGHCWEQHYPQRDMFKVAPMR